MRVNREAFEKLCEGAEIVSAHSRFGPKVVLLPSGDYIKVFNPKSGLSKRKFFPKYKQFIKNTEQLAERGIASVKVNQLYFLEENRSYAVSYSPLAGKDLRSLALEESARTLQEFIPFLVELHEKGIYFRGIHLGNVLKLDKGNYGLIDVADLYFKPRPLSLLMRVRNLLHLFKNRDDAGFYAEFGLDLFVESYARQCGFTHLEKFMFNLLMRRGKYQFARKAAGL